MLPEEREHEEAVVVEENRVDHVEENDTGDCIPDHPLDRSIISSTHAPSDLRAIDEMRCNVCSKSLSLPAFQCINEHIVCAECHNKSDTCTFCNVTFTECGGSVMEKVLQSSKIACKNASFGCKEVLLRNEKRAHQKSCTFQPFPCPLSDCNFVSNIVVLRKHFKENHQLERTTFSYNEVFHVSLDVDDNGIVLQALNDDKLFLITNVEDRVGSMIINLDYIGLRQPNPEFYFKMMVSSQEGGDILGFKSKVTNIQDQNNPSLFFYIPFGFFQFTRWLNMEIRIRMVGDVQPDEDQSP